MSNPFRSSFQARLDAAERRWRWVKILGLVLWALLLAGYLAALRWLVS